MIGFDDVVSLRKSHTISDKRALTSCFNKGLMGLKSHGSGISKSLRGDVDRGVLLRDVALQLDIAVLVSTGNREWKVSDIAVNLAVDERGLDIHGHPRNAVWGHRGIDRSAMQMA